MKTLRDYSQHYQYYLYAMLIVLTGNIALNVFTYFNKNAVAPEVEYTSIGVLIMVIMLGPALEEFVFRRIILKNLVKHFNNFWMINIIVSSVFAAVHIQAKYHLFVNVLIGLSTFLVSLTLGHAMIMKKKEERDRDNLSFAWSIHAFTNLTTVAFVWLVAGIKGVS